MVIAAIEPPKLKAASQVEETNEIECWTRKPGNYSDGTDWPKDHVRKFNLDQHSGPEQTRFDYQYNRKYTFKGVPLKEIIEAYEAPSNQDFVLLHFANNMIIPVPRDQEILKKLDALVVRKIKIGKKWESDFPTRPKKDPIYTDPRPIQFKGNKIVVKSSWHPTAKNAGNSGFSPWQFADALTGIEFVNHAAYVAQFLPETSAVVVAGHKEFLERCSFCHGVRRIGASFGWDFVEPLPTYKRRGPDQLLNHVKYPKWDALERGLMMPAQKGATELEIANLWKWLESVGTKPAKPYAP